ncbi:MAG: hypothetical protein U0169_02000 [Polyangiaceae bacterium]
MALRSMACGVLISFVALGAGCASAGSEEGTVGDQGQAATTVSLRVPLLEQVTITKTVRGKKVKVQEKRLLEGRNAQARANGIAPFPKFVTITAATGGKPFDDAMSRADDLSEKLPDGQEIETISLGAGPEYSIGRGASAVRLCYTGEPKKAMDLLTSLGDGILSDQFSLNGWRYKTAKFDRDSQPMSAADEAEFWGDDAPELWKEWRGQGEAILMESSIGDDGTDVNETIIPKCR